MTKRLGRGLEEIIGPAPQSASNFVLLKTEQIKPGRFQPRTEISDRGLEELKASIQRQGVIEPIIVRPVAHGTYELVAGERRWRAAQALGMKEVPTLIKSLSDKEALEYSLIENVQRENLNPVEEAKGYARLLDEFGYTQEEIAIAVGKDRTTVANMLRLLKLPADILSGVREGAISMGHAKALLMVDDHAKQLELYRHATKGGGLSVRQLEALVGTWVPGTRRRGRRVDLALKPLEDELKRALGTKVTLSARKKGGRLIVDYFSSEDLTRIVRLLGVAV